MVCPISLTNLIKLIISTRFTQVVFYFVVPLNESCDQNSATQPIYKAHLLNSCTEVCVCVIVKKRTGVDWCNEGLWSRFYHHKILFPILDTKVDILFFWHWQNSWETILWVDSVWQGRTYKWIYHIKLRSPYCMLTFTCWLSGTDETVGTSSGGLADSSDRSSCKW